MKKKTSLSFILGITLCCGFATTSCSDDNGTIIKSPSIDGKWTYDGMIHSVQTSLDPVTNIIVGDITSRNMNSMFELNLNSGKGSYILTESTILVDSGRFVRGSDAIEFESRYRDKAYLEDSYFYVDDNNIVLSIDALERYSDKHVLDSLGVSNPDAVVVSEASYAYVFKR